MEELKPCPFCGGESVLHNSPRLLSPYVSCRNCGASRNGYCEDTADAIAQWNERLMRTCTYDEGDDYHLVCSACGWDRRGALNIPNYCPHCGAKVENATKEEDVQGRGWVALNEVV